MRFRRPTRCLLRQSDRSRSDVRRCLRGLCQGGDRCSCLRLRRYPASRVARKRAYEAAGRALALNPQLSLGYSVLALLQMLDGQHEEAVASARKAVALGPNSAEAYLNLAVVLVYAGLHEDALRGDGDGAATEPEAEPSGPRISGLRAVHEPSLCRRARGAGQGTGRGHGRPRPGNARRGQRPPGATGRGEAAIKTLLQRQPECASPGFASPSRIMPESRI